MHIEYRYLIEFWLNFFVTEFSRWTLRLCKLGRNIRLTHEKRKHNEIQYLCIRSRETLPYSAKQELIFFISIFFSAKKDSIRLSPLENAIRHMCNAKYRTQSACENMFHLLYGALFCLVFLSHVSHSTLIEADMQRIFSHYMQQT